MSARDLIRLAERIISPMFSGVISPIRRPAPSLTPTAGRRFSCIRRRASSRLRRCSTIGMSERITSMTGASGPRSFSALIISSRVSTPRSRPPPVRRSISPGAPDCRD
jgi:hypothetical protein